MHDLACPNCGGMGRIPREKVNTRLTCKKCHMVFHMATSGRTILGEPPAEQGKGDRRSGRDGSATAKQRADWKENLPEFNVTGRSALITLILLVVFGLGYFFYTREPETLSDRGKLVGEAFVADSLSRVKAYSSPDSVDEVVQWYGIAKRVLDDRKKIWTGRDIRVGCVPIDENRRQRTGEVLISLVPSHASPQAEKIISNNPDIAEMAKRSLELSLHFTLDSWGKWRLDGRRTLVAAPKTGL
jgi:hypothetical protein